MTIKQATWLFANGGGVVYHNHLYQIRKVNNDKGTCLLVSLPYEYLVLNVPISEITAETEYDWDDGGRIMKQVYTVISDYHFKDTNGHYIDVAVFKDKTDGLKFMASEVERLKAKADKPSTDFAYMELDFENGYGFLAGDWREVQMGVEK